MRFLSLTAVFLLLLINFPRGQGKPDSTLSFTIDSVVVRSSRYTVPLSEVPLTINTIDSKTLDNIYNPLSLEEVLNNSPGIIVNNRSNPSQGDRLVIRGVGTRAQFGVRGIKIFLDGIPLTFADGQAQLNNLNNQDLEISEILMGPSSVLYGNALGGAVFFKSKIEKTGGTSFKPGFSAGSYGLNKFNIGSVYNFSKGNYLSLSAYYLTSQGFRDHSDSKYYGVNLQSRFSLSNNLYMNIVSNFFNAPYLLNPSTLNKEEAEKNPKSVRNSILTFASGKMVRQFHNGIGLEYLFSVNTKINTIFYLASRGLDNSIPGRIINLDRIFAGLRTEFEKKFFLFDVPFNFLTGIDYEFQLDDRKEFENGGIPDNSNIDPSKIFDELIYLDKLLDQEENLRTAGFFAHLNFEPLDKLKLFAGLRYDDFLFGLTEMNNVNNLDPTEEISMSNYSYTAGFNYKLKENVTIYGNISSGFQTPTINELSNNPSGKGFNKELDPELVSSYEVGLKNWLGDFNLYSQLSFYKMDFTNMLIGYQSATEEIFYRNAGKAENFGIEAQIEFYPWQIIKIYASYSLMNFKYTDYILSGEINGRPTNIQLRGNYLPGIPKNMINAFVEYSGLQNFDSRLSIVYSDKYFANDFNGPADPSHGDKNDYINDAYLRADLSIRYKIFIFDTPVTLGLKTENIFNERFNGSIVPNAFGKNFFEPAPGRSYYFNFALLL